MLRRAGHRPRSDDPGAAGARPADVEARAAGFKANAIEWANGRWVGAADPRSEGAAVAESGRANGRESGKQLEHFPNLVTMFLTRAREKGDKPFLWAKRDGAWQSISWAEAARQVAALAESLKRDRARSPATGSCWSARTGPNGDRRPRRSWPRAASRCRPTPPTPTRDHQHILDNSGARAVIVSTQKLAETLLPAVLFASECQHVIAIDDIITGQSPDVAHFHHWDDLVAGESDIGALEQRDGRGRARRPRLHHLHQRHRRRAARRDAAPRRDPAQCRRLHRHHRQRFRLGRRGVPVLPAGQPRL